jgi:large subunit ribosomal protein L15
MDLSNLQPAKGSVKKSKRIGRGQGSGHGGTSTRGHKGANSRSGNKKKHHFEGGQMPLQRRVPKRGFTNPNSVEFTTLNLDQIQTMTEKYGMTNFDMDILLANGVIGKNDKLKVLGRGELKVKVDLHAHAFSKTAKEAIEAIGGTANLIG